jgi:hypothetical protein
VQTGPPARQPTSVVLGDLFLRVPAEHVTLEWLLRGLGDRSFGVLLLLLALLGALPGVSVAVGLLLPIPAYQMLRAHPGPVFPRAVASRPIATGRLTSLVRRIVPVLRLLERVVHPRWTTPFEATKRVVGAAVLPVSMGFFVPLPLSNIAPAAVVTLIAFAYLEQDGLLLLVGLLTALAVVAGVAILAWETLSATGWMPGLL